MTMSAAPSVTPAVSTPPPGEQANHGCLPRGYRLREFVIERVLGDGGFGVVYAALDLRLERRVAIKEYMPSSLARRDTDYSVQMLTSKRHRDAFEVGLRSFINEARLLARFEHPSLVKVHQFWQEKGTAYMVMPFYSAPTLRTWIRDQPAPVSEEWLRTFLLGAMDAVEVLHAESCLHRDIAPDNLLVLKDRAPLLLDFGAARRVIGDLRKALTVIVKPGFAPLEQYADTVKMKQGPWTDVYALAAVAHYIITGHAPAPAVSRVLADDVIPLRVRAKGKYSDALLGAIDTALAVKPEQRPQTIAAFRNLLTSSQAGEWEPTRLIRREAAAIAQKTIVPSRMPRTGPAAASALKPPMKTAPMRSAPVASNSDATTMLRATPRTRDVATLTRAVLASIPESVRQSRWVDFAGYAAALLACGGVLALTSYLVEGYVVANTAITRSQVQMAAPAPQPQVARTEPPATQPATQAPTIQAPAIQPPPTRLTGTEAMVEAKPTEVTLAPAKIDLPSLAPVAPLAPAAPPAPAAATTAAKPKPAPLTKVSTVERVHHETRTAALMLTASAPATSIAGGSTARKSRGLDEMVVPLERAAEIAQVAPVQLVIAAQPEPVLLRAINRPEPQFPVAAAKFGVRDGRVLARLNINADGSVGRIDIVDAHPSDLFDAEVRRVLSTWRYEAPGQPRQSTVEILFKRDE